MRELLRIWTYYTVYVKIKTWLASGLLKLQEPTIAAFCAALDRGGLHEVSQACARAVARHLRGAAHCVNDEVHGQWRCRGDGRHLLRIDPVGHAHDDHIRHHEVFLGQSLSFWLRSRTVLLLRSVGTSLSPLPEFLK